MPESIALNCDCMEYMRSLPDKAFDVVVADPPYNIAKAAWDKWPSVDAYVSDVMAWLREYSQGYGEPMDVSFRYVSALPHNG